MSSCRKPLLTGPDGAAKDETRATAAWALDEILKLLHPFMPFITEELWRVTAETGPKRDALLVLAPWPKHDGLDDAKAEAEIGWLIDLVTAIRSVRVEMNIPASTPIPVVLAGASAETKARAEPLGRVRQAAARALGDITFADAPPQGSVQLLIRGEVAALPLKGVIDFAAERARLRQGNAEGRSPTSSASTRSSAIRSSSPTRAEDIVEGERKSARRPKPAAARSSRRWSGCKARGVTQLTIAPRRALRFDAWRNGREAAMADEAAQREILKHAYKRWSDTHGDSVDEWMKICADNIAFGSLAQGAPQGATT